MTRKNSMSRLTSELDKLQKQLQNAREADRVQREMEGFKRLYNKFVTGTGEDRGKLDFMGQRITCFKMIATTNGSSDGKYAEW